MTGARLIGRRRALVARVLAVRVVLADFLADAVTVVPLCRTDLYRRA
jgi:hypothetical protein